MDVILFLTLVLPIAVGLALTEWLFSRRVPSRTSKRRPADRIGRER